MDFLIGVGLLVYCLGLSIYTVYTEGSFLDPRTLLQLLTSGVGSAIILLPILWGKIKDIDFNIPDLPSITPNKEKEVDLPECNEKIKMDTECLHYLKHRAAEIGSDEAMEMVIKLNTILFADVCDKEKEDE